ncbi:hypothetical protein HRbin32_00086 [bacterium HR32]|nr:hypothetical protein HRbin32_00086 [bacterium HR32]
MLGEQGDVLHPLPQGRQLDGYHAEAVEQVLAEAAVPDGLPQVLVGGCDDAHVHPHGFVAPHPLEGALLQDPEQLHLHGGAHVADFVEEDGAAVRGLELPHAAPHRAGEGTLLVSEQLRLQERLRDGAAVDGHEGSVGPRALVVDGPGEDLLARARLPVDEDRGVRGRHRRGHPQHLLHLRGRAHDALELEARPQLLVQLAVLLPELLVLQGAADLDHQLVLLEGLGDVVEGAVPHRLHGHLQGGVPGDDHHHRARVLPPDLPQDLHAVLLRDPHVQQHQVELPGAGLAQARGAVGGGLDLEPLLAQDLAQEVPDVLLVVHHEDPTASQRSVPRSRMSSRLCVSARCGRTPVCSSRTPVRASVQVGALAGVSAAVPPRPPRASRLPSWPPGRTAAAGAGTCGGARGPARGSPQTPR